MIAQESEPTLVLCLDRTVYPVPFGSDDFQASTQQLQTVSLFPVHQSAMGGQALLVTRRLRAGEFLNGDLTIHVRVNDPDFDVSATGEDTIATLTNRAPCNAVDGPPRLQF